jgi:hypothetical protein
LDRLAVRWHTQEQAVLDEHGTLVTALDTPQPTDISGRSLFRYEVKAEEGDQSGPLASDVALVVAATTSVGGSGSEQNAPLQSYDLTWLPGGDCPAGP